MKNNEITIQGEKNGLLPMVDAFGFYGASALGGTAESSADQAVGRARRPMPCQRARCRAGYGGALQNLFDQQQSGLWRRREH